MKFIFFVLLALLFNRPIASAQTAVFSDSIVVEKLFNYSKSQPSEILFVHLDKTIYTNNEQVWFSAYFINDDTVAINRHNYLSVSIVREDNKQISLENKYLIADGLCFGNLSLPDTLHPGKYMFTAFSNVVDQNNKPVAIFSQLIIIKSVVINTIKASLTLADSISLQALVKVEDEFFHSINNATVNYTINGQAFKTLLSNDKGIAVIPILQRIEAQIVQVKVSVNNENQLLSLAIPGSKKDSNIVARFYPESGNLIAGVESKVGIETTMSNGSPLSVKGILYKNDIPVDTIYTADNGLASFRITPNSGDNFLMKLFDRNKQAFEFSLPEILANGVAISMEGALTGDTAIFNISSSIPKYLQVYIHNDANLFGSVSVDATQENKKIKLILNDMPTGIVTITVTDDSGRPLAERLFFAHFFKRPSTTATTDTSTYSRHAKVTLKVKLDDFENNSLTGIVSIACVQANRLTNASRNDIETYVYLKHLFENIPPTMGRQIENEMYMENLLLIKGWRRYTWQTLMKASLDSAVQLQSIPITGRTYIEERISKKAVELIIIRDSSLDLFSTEKEGRFVLNPIAISIQEGRKVFMSVNNNTYAKKNELRAFYNIDTQLDLYKGTFKNNKINNEMKFNIEINNPQKAILNDLIPFFNFIPFVTSTNYINDKELNDQEIPGLTRLKEVVIKSKKDNLLKGIFGSGMGPNDCGDYICQEGILNCPYHYDDIMNRTPVKGEWYWVPSTNYNPDKKPYYGCEIVKKQTAINIPGVYLTREFYGVEQKQKDVAVPEYLSTIFWKPGVIINTEKNTEFSFYTSDITGNFKVIIQGVTDNKDVVYKEINFKVVD